MLAAASPFALAQPAPTPADRWTLGVQGFTDSGSPKAKSAKPKLGDPQAKMLLGQNQAATGTCSVPLTRAPIPGDVNYVIAEAPTHDSKDGMPKAVLPAPPCAEPSLQSARRLTAPRR